MQNWSDNCQCTKAKAIKISRVVSFPVYVDKNTTDRDNITLTRQILKPCLQGNIQQLPFVTLSLKNLSSMKWMKAIIVTMKMTMVVIFHCKYMSNANIISVERRNHLFMHTFLVV